MNIALINCLSANMEFLYDALDTVQYTHAYWIFLLPVSGAEILALVD